MQGSISKRIQKSPVVADYYYGALISAKIVLQPCHGLYGLLDDAGFARRRAAELLRKRKSRREILQDLAAKGVDRETAAAAVEALRPEDAAEAGEDPDLASARALIARQYARKLAEGKTQQVMAALARRGFSHSVIKAAVGEAVEELETGNGE